MAVPIVDSGRVVIRGNRIRFPNTLKLNGEPYDLTGKTVTATIRSELDATAPVSDGAEVPTTLENLSVEVLDNLTGSVRCVVEPELSALMDTGSTKPNYVKSYLLQYLIVEDDIRTSKLRFGVTMAFD